MRFKVAFSAFSSPAEALTICALLRAIATRWAVGRRCPRTACFWVESEAMFIMAEDMVTGMLTKRLTV
eukprot:2162334-Pyramimonas_sp.AAC.1